MKSCCTLHSFVCNSPIYFSRYDTTEDTNTPKRYTPAPFKAKYTYMLCTKSANENYIPFHKNPKITITARGRIALRTLYSARKRQRFKYIKIGNRLTIGTKRNLFANEPFLILSSPESISFRSRSFR